jgi:hypothetical protein
MQMKRLLEAGRNKLGEIPINQIAPFNAQQIGPGTIDLLDQTPLIKDEVANGGLVI